MDLLASAVQVLLTRIFEWLDAHALWILSVIATFTLMKPLYKRLREAALKEASPYVDDVGKTLTRTVISRLFSGLFNRRRHFVAISHHFNEVQRTGLKTQNPFVVPLNEVYINLHLSPTSPSKVSNNMIQYGSSEHSVPMWQHLANRDIRTPVRIAIIGPAGCGKTTILHHIAFSLASTVFADRLSTFILHSRPDAFSKWFDISVSQRRTDRLRCKHCIRFIWRYYKRVPVFVSLLSISKISGFDKLTLGNLFLKTMHFKPGHSYNIWFTWIDMQLAKGRCTILMDGLDEVPGNSIAAVSAYIRHLTINFPDNDFIISSRPYNFELLDDALIKTTLVVSRVSLGDASAFAENWFFQNEARIRNSAQTSYCRLIAKQKAEDFVSTLQRRMDLAELAGNLLLLTMMVIVSEYGVLPDRRVDLYEEICDVMLSRRMLKKGLVSKYTYQHKITVAEEIAYQLFVQRLATRDGRKLQVKLPVGKKAVATKISQYSGIIFLDDFGEFTFCHKSLLEYLVARRIRSTSSEKQLVEHLLANDWREVVYLYIQLPFCDDSLARKVVDDIRFEYADVFLELIRSGFSPQEDVVTKYINALADVFYGSGDVGILEQMRSLKYLFWARCKGRAEMPIQEFEKVVVTGHLGDNTPVAEAAISSLVGKVDIFMEADIYTKEVAAAIQRQIQEFAGNTVKVYVSRVHDEEFNFSSVWIEMEMVATYIETDMISRASLYATSQEVSYQDFVRSLRVSSNWLTPIEVVRIFQTLDEVEYKYRDIAVGIARDLEHGSPSWDDAKFVGAKLRQLLVKSATREIGKEDVYALRDSYCSYRETSCAAMKSIIYHIDNLIERIENRNSPSFRLVAKFREEDDSDEALV